MGDAKLAPSPAGMDGWVTRGMAEQYAGNVIADLLGALRAIIDQESINGHSAETRMMDMADIARAAIRDFIGDAE